MGKSLVIFDMDGVVIDSEPIYYNFVREFFQKYGIILTDKKFSDLFDEITGMSNINILEFTFDKYNICIPDINKALIEVKKFLYEMIKNYKKLKPRDNIQKFISKLKKRGYVVVLASSNDRNIINLILEKINMTKAFEGIFSGGELKRSKPDPEIFNKVLATYNVEPENAVVIEDSTNGVLASKRAHIKCIGFKHEYLFQDLELADLVIENFNQLSIGIIEEI